MTAAPKLHSQPSPPPPPAGEKGVWFPLADAGALKIYDFKDDTPIADPGVSLPRDHLQTFRYAAIIGIVGHLLQALPNTADGSSIQAL